MDADLNLRIDDYLSRLFAQEDDALRSTLDAEKEHGLPAIHVSSVQGKSLYVLAKIARAKNILEIGALGGYSGIWLARALPEGGKLITLELEEKHADVAREAYHRAGVAEKVEVRVGPALDSMPMLQEEGWDFDLVFIDADKGNYPNYLDWALKLTHPGSVIIGDNTIRNGTIGDESVTNPDAVSLREFNRLMATNPRLESIAFPIIKHGVDGMTVGYVKE